MWPLLLQLGFSLPATTQHCTSSWWHLGRAVTEGPSLLHLWPWAPPRPPQTLLAWLVFSTSTLLSLLKGLRAWSVQHWPALFAPRPHRQSLVTVPVMSPLPPPAAPLTSLGQRSTCGHLCLLTFQTHQTRSPNASVHYVSKRTKIFSFRNSTE